MSMAKTIVAQTMSLDGFIAAPDDDVWPLFGWYTAGDTDLPVKGVPRAFKVSAASAALIRREWDSIGAIVTGRRDFDVSEAWGGIPPLGVPIFILTHNPPGEWSKEGSPFTFVTDGVESAVAQAKRAANGRNVTIGGSQVVQQCLLAGLVDEIAIELAPILLGSGIRLFDNLDGKRIELAYTGVVEGTGVTHLRFRVLK
jgi:dihydrofolate reductase